MCKFRVIYLCVFVFICLFSLNAQAQDTGWELTVGVGYGGYLHSDVIHWAIPTHFDSGLSVMAIAGYRFTDWFSLQIEQTYMQIWDRKDVDSVNEMMEDEHHETSAIGETALTVKFIWLNDARNFELYLKFGFGTFYGKEFNQFEHYWNYSNGKDELKYHITDKDSSFVTWSIPIGVGLNYYFNDMYGIGVDIQYDFILECGYYKVNPHFAIRF